MGIDLQLFIEPDRIRAVATGEFSLEEAERTFLELMDAVVRHKVEKILIDGREISGSLTVMERFSFGAFTADTVDASVMEGKVHNPQFAYVLAEPVLDPYRLGESVAMNRGMRIKMFEDVDDALQWLGLIPPEKGNSAEAWR